MESYETVGKMVSEKKCFGSMKIRCEVSMVLPLRAMIYVFYNCRLLPKSLESALWALFYEEMRRSWKGGQSI